MSKEHAYAYEAGYRDGAINYELDHCPACKNVADLQEALAENDKLRQENQSVGMDAYELGRASLAAENAKLRELVRDMDECLEHSKPLCKGCRFQEPQERNCQWFEFDERMRELGVEVDE